MNILSQGIDILCKDAAVESLITPDKENIIVKITNYINEIELFNSAYGLVSVNNTNELVIKHILDSLAPLGIIYRKLIEETSAKTQRKEKEKYFIADAGSGAGLPGIPLSIVIQNCDFTLIERMGRRAGFLFNTKAALFLSNVNVEENDLEKIAAKKNNPALFDLITFRAFKPLEPKLLKTLFKICAPGGIIAAYKGRREKIEEEMRDIMVNWEAIPYTVPFLDENRHLLVIRNDPK